MSLIYWLWNASSVLLVLKLHSKYYEFFFLSAYWKLNIISYWYSFVIYVILFIFQKKKIYRFVPKIQIIVLFCVLIVLKVFAVGCRIWRWCRQMQLRTCH